jgi:F-type H+-transporting ATPase subunit c
MSLLNIILQAASGISGAGLAAIGAAMAVIGAGLGIGKIGASAMDAIGRQPDAASEIRMNMIIVAALIEGAALFAIVVCLMAIG